MKTRNCCLPVLLALILTACAGSTPPRERTLFTDGWRFILGDDPSYSSAGYDDSGWRTLCLPHDWSVEGDFSEDAPAGTGGGSLPGGVGWYRKTFRVPADGAGQRYRIDFDGVYMKAEVFINGTSLGMRPYGFITFGYDITPYLRFGEDNVVAVRVDNALQPSNRWFSGCGIYRNVWLTRTQPLHIAHDGVYVRADSIGETLCTISISTTLENTDGYEVNDVTLRSMLLDSEGVQVAAVTSASGGLQVEQKLEVAQPHLWDVDDPYLYTLRSELIVGGSVADVIETNVGLRSFRFDAREGFILNGRHLKINGVCLHHDNGCLGAAVNVRAKQRQLEMLKEMGCNGVRTSHNPPAPELLDLCDRMGFIVMDEAFDMWRKKKTTYDYANYFNEWHERDLTDFIIRDRNHPCIFIWSIGNEVLEQWTHVDADTLSLEDANLLLNFGHSNDALAAEGTLSVNSLLTSKLADIVRSLDPTRPITAGCNEPDPGNHLFRAGALDIIGYNYHSVNVPDVPANFPGMPFIYTESNSALMTRGYYRMPSDSVYIWPARWDMLFDEPSYSCSSYDNCRVPWGNTNEETLCQVRDNDFISGQYIWTGFDYLGEPTPFRWPAHSSYFGIIDLAGFPKDAFYLYKAEWTDDPVLHLFPHWNWTEGETIDLWCYYNDADEVELFINGKSQGVSSKTADRLHAEWRVTFEPGTAKAVARRDGNVVRETEIRTAGEPYTLRLTPDRSVLQADGRDLSFVTVEVLDENGVLCPNAMNEVRFTTSGHAFIAGVDNGNPISLERFKADKRKAFYGKCLVILQSDGGKGSCTLTAESDGLQQAQTVVKFR